MPDSKNVNGVRLPVWMVSIIIALVLQTGLFVASFSSFKTTVTMKQESMGDDISEIKFRVGNIDDGMASLQKDATRLETKCEDYDRRFTRLERYHGVELPQ